jgi:DNA-binding NtrC family response regulator
MSESALTLLIDYQWPGNVRELENVIERAVTLARGDRIMAEDLPPAIQGARREKRVIDEAAERVLPLDRSNGNISFTSWRRPAETNIKPPRSSESTERPCTEN